MTRIQIDGFKRISKAKARKLYDGGYVIRLVPCRIRPVNYWDYYADVDRDRLPIVDYDGFNTTIARNSDFDTVVNAFTYYNCSTETGRYPAFFVKTA